MLLYSLLSCRDFISVRLSLLLSVDNLPGEAIKRKETLFTLLSIVSGVVESINLLANDGLADDVQ